jgi:hypothetical protein
MKTLNSLNASQLVKLGRWLEGNLSQLQHTHRSVIAENASAALGFAVSEHNVKSASDAWELVIASPRRNPSGDDTSASSTQYLSAAIIELFLSVGSEPPKYLRMLATRHTLDKVREEYQRHLVNKSST